MPRSSRVRRPHRSAKSAQRILAEMRNQLLDIEPPLRDAMHYVWALHFIGMGLIADDDDAGEPVATVARAATEQLEAVRAIWDRLCGAALRPKLGKKLREHE